MGRTAGAGRDAMDADAYRALAGRQRRKYGNVKTTVDGIVFDSAAEARRYKELQWMEAAGDIDYLQVQPRYELVVNDTKIGEYRADFRYLVADGTCRWVTEDVKGVRTAVYQIKKKLVKALYNIDITEVE